MKARSSSSVHPDWEKGGEEIQVAETDREFFERINRKYLNENGGNDADIQ